MARFEKGARIKKINGGAPALLARNSAAAESEDGQKFLPPNPHPFCPPERFDFIIRKSDFGQKMFENRSKNTTKEVDHVHPAGEFSGLVKILTR
ncbi:MAG: hypothetical protein Q8N99_03280 [Nanoarchaeota archaeon]|nr:hypothetical protein [Nanoarchaeota archaeon]